MHSHAFPRISRIFFLHSHAILNLVVHSRAIPTHPAMCVRFVRCRAALCNVCGFRYARFPCHAALCNVCACDAMPRSIRAGSCALWKHRATGIGQGTALEAPGNGHRAGHGRALALTSNGHPCNSIASPRKGQIIHRIRTHTEQHVLQRVDKSPNK